MMKFKLVDRYAYWWPVVVAVPDPENPGKVIEQMFEARFEAQTEEEQRKQQEAYERLMTDNDRSRHEHAALYAVTKDWRGVASEGGGDEPFTPAAFERAMQHSWFRLGMYKAYRDSIYGNAARLGN